MILYVFGVFVVSMLLNSGMTVDNFMDIGWYIGIIGIIAVYITVVFRTVLVDALTLRGPPSNYLRVKYKTPLHKIVYVLFILNFNFVASDDDDDDGGGKMAALDLSGTKTEQEDRLPSREAKTQTGHKAPEGKQSNTADGPTFLQRYLLHKWKFTNLDQRSTANNYTSVFTEGLENDVIQHLTTIATYLNQTFKEASAHLCNADSNSTMMDRIKVLFWGSYAPDHEDAHTQGILSTWVTTGFDHESRSTNTEPCSNGKQRNPSIHQFYLTISLIMSIEYGIPFDVAYQIWNEISAWVDSIQLTLPNKSSNNGGTKLYKKAKEMTAQYTMKYIRCLIGNIPNLECIVVLGNEAFDFFNMMKKEGMIPAYIKIIQNHPIIHPSKLLAFGASLREAHWMYMSIVGTLSHLVGASAPDEVSKNNIHLAFINRNSDDERGSFIYKASVNVGGVDTVLFVTRGYSEVKRVIRSWGGSVPEEFPTFKEIVGYNGNYEFRELTLELIWYEDYDCTQKFGVHNERDMKAWVKKAKKIRGNEWTKKETQRKSWLKGGMGSVASTFTRSRRG